MKIGTIFYADKSRYEGEIKNSKLRHGKGKLFNAFGELIFEGVYIDDIAELVKNKEIKDTFNQEEYTYNGKFDENGKFTGKGIIYYKNGDIYDGHFKNGLYNGMGNLFVKDKFVYNGHFEDNFMDGIGT